MPSNHRVTVVMLPEELKAFHKEAKEKDIGLSTLMRRKLGLPELKKGRALDENPSEQALYSRMYREKTKIK